MEKDIDNQLLSELQACDTSNQKASYIIDNFIEAGVDIGTSVITISVADIVTAMANGLTNEEIALLEPIGVIDAVAHKMEVPWDEHIVAVLKAKFIY